MDFQKKLKLDGSTDKYKTRLVANGYRQKEIPDNFNTYSLVTRIMFIQLLIAIAALDNLDIHQMDIKTTLNEEIYME